MLFPVSTQAAVTYSDVVDIPIPITFNGVYLNLAVSPADTLPPDEADVVGPDSYTIGYDQPADWDVNFFFGGIGIAYSPTFQPFVDDTVSARSQILNVAFGTNIQAEAASRTLGVNSYGGSGTSNGGTGESHFNTPDLDGPTYSAFTSGTSGTGQQGYIAFTLETVSGTQYGWMRVTLDNDGDNNGGNFGTIHAWAYSDESTFTVGEIPEPGLVSFLLLGAAGLLRRRRRE
jgi:uncharacterized protein (TIGR03382 family)